MKQVYCPKCGGEDIEALHLDRETDKPKRLSMDDIGKEDEGSALVYYSTTFEYTCKNCGYKVRVTR